MKTRKPGIVRLITSLLLVLPLLSHGKTVKWNLKERWGVNQLGIASAISEAKQHFISFPNDSIVIIIPEGTFNIGGNNDHSIDVSNIEPGEKGRLIFQGAGKDRTTFIATDRTEHSIYGRNIHRITFKGIHFTRDYNCVLQGTVISVSPGEVVLDLHEGFPKPDSLWQYGIVGSWGMFFKRYTDDIDDPQIITEENDQIAWNKDGTYKVEGRRWKFALRNLDQTAPYMEGDIIGIKLKHGGQTYWFANGDDIAFEDCKWTQKTRGVLRAGISNIRFVNCTTERGPRVGGRIPCLASPDGGPQCGQPNDPVINNVLIENCDFFASGDDNVAFFNVNGGVIRNCHITDSFARGILLYQCENICLENNIVERCPILWVEGDGYSKCDTPTGQIDLNIYNDNYNIYPNPFQDLLFVEQNYFNQADSRIGIFDEKGALVLSSKLRKGINEIDLSREIAGCYIVKLTNDLFTVQQKVLKIN